MYIGFYEEILRSTESLMLIYVKTVLTFGDKPAPATAQISCFEENSRTEQGQVLTGSWSVTSNVYMDDICELVDTVKEAMMSAIALMNTK